MVSLPYFTRLQGDGTLAGSRVLYVSQPIRDGNCAESFIGVRSVGEKYLKIFALNRPRSDFSASNLRFLTIVRSFITNLNSQSHMVIAV